MLEQKTSGALDAMEVLAIAWQKIMQDKMVDDINDLILEYLRPKLPSLKGPLVTIPVRDQQGSEVELMINENAPLRELMDAYCNHRGLKCSQVRFMVDGERVGENDAAETLDCGTVISAYEMQVGGAGNEHIAERSAKIVADAAARALARAEAERAAKAAVDAAARAAEAARTLDRLEMPPPPSPMRNQVALNSSTEWTRMTSRNNSAVSYYWNQTTGETLTEEEYQQRRSGSSTSSSSSAGSEPMMEMMRELVATLSQVSASSGSTTSQAIELRSLVPTRAVETEDRWTCGICGWKNRPRNGKCGGGFPGFGCSRDRRHCESGLKTVKKRSRSRSRDRRR